MRDLPETEDHGHPIEVLLLTSCKVCHTSPALAQQLFGEPSVLWFFMLFPLYCIDLRETTGLLLCKSKPEAGLQVKVLEVGHYKENMLFISGVPNSF